MAAAYGNRAVLAHCSVPVVLGGYAFGRQAPRLPKEVYKQLVAELKTKLVPNFYMTVEAPRSFASKTSFGDVDLLASVPQKVFDPMTDLDSSESKQNGNIMHFDYQGYQVDVIEIDERTLQLARFCYIYGDTGMVVGFFARSLGLHFGLGILTCCVLGTYKVNLSQDLRAILKFLDLDYGSWEQGFETQEDMFHYLASSKYFRPFFFFQKQCRSARASWATTSEKHWYQGDPTCLEPLPPKASWASNVSRLDEVCGDTA